MTIRLAAVISILAVAVRGNQSDRPDEFTPVVISALTATTHSVRGTDAKQHVVYELLVTNANATPAKIQKIEVVDGHNPSSVMATYEGNELLSRLRTTAHGSVDSTEIEYNGTRLFLISPSASQSIGCSSMAPGASFTEILRMCTVIPIMEPM